MKKKITIEQLERKIKGKLRERKRETKTYKACNSLVNVMTTNAQIDELLLVLAMIDGTVND